MQFTLVAALLAAGAEIATATPSIHRHAGHAHKHPALAKRELSSSCTSKLSALGMGVVGGVFGTNAFTAGSSGIWIGNDGSYTNTFVNHSPHEVCLVVWGDQPSYQASFVSAVTPMVSVSIPPNGAENVTLSFAENQSGAWAGVYPETILSPFGQISNTWGEFTMAPSGVVDVSREVFTQGRHMRIKGPDCVSDMERCVFVCSDPSVTTCGDAGSYQLLNCAPGSQAGAQTSPDNTAGGCGWLGKSSVALETYFH